jgi:hypothetical protein
MKRNMPPTTTAADPTPVETHAHVNAQRVASTRWVPLGQMKVTPAAQRKFQAAHAQEMADDFDLEALGYPVLNYRTDPETGKKAWFIVDGQHRIAALRIIGFADDDVVECETYTGLTEAQEADLFLRRARNKAIHPLDKFRIGVNAGREDECAIQRIVEGLDLRVGFGSNKIAAVGTLTKIYGESGGSALGRTLLIIREAYGETGFSASMISGVGAVIRRYGLNVDTDRLVKALRAAPGGATGIEQGAAVLVRSTGNSKAVCVGAEIVKFYNRTRGKKLANWWKDKGEEAE